MALSAANFSKKIKEKYPQYKDVDDLELAQKIVAKYPEYKDKVVFGDVKKKVQAEPISEDFTPVQPQKQLDLSKEQETVSVNPFVKAVSKNPKQVDVINPTEYSVEQTINQYDQEDLVDSQKLKDLTDYLKSPDLQDITKWNLDKGKEKEIKQEVFNNFDYLDTLPQEQAEAEIKNKVWENTKSNTLANAAVQEYKILKDFKTTLNTEVTEPTDEYLNLFTNIIEQTNKQKFGVETNIQEVEIKQQRKNKIYADYANYLKETNPDAYNEYQDGLLTKDNKKSAMFYNNAISHQYKLINAKAATGVLDKEDYEVQVEALAKEQKDALMYFPETKKEIDETERRKAENDKRYNQFKQTLEDPNASAIDKAIASQGIGYYQVIQPAISAATKFGAGIIATVGRAAALSESLKPEEISFEDEINGLVDDFSDYIETTSERLMPSQLQGGLFEDGEFKGEKLMPKVTETMTEMVLLISTGGVVGSGLKAAGTSALAAERAGLMATSFFRTYNDYYEEASDMVGMSEKDKTLFALTSATTTSALELINPQRYLTGVKGVSAFSPKKALDDIAKGISIPQAIKQNAKISGKEIVFENLQELSQEVGDKVNKYVFNEVVGTTFDTEISRDELAEIAVLTSIVSGGASTIQYRGKNTLKVETFEWARNNKELFEKATESETNLQAVGKDNIEQAKKDVEEYTKIYEAMPSKYSDAQKAYLSSKQLDLQKLKERQKSLDALEPQIVAEEKEKVEGAIQEAEKEITSIINKGNYVLTEGGEEKNLSLEEINNLAEDEEFIAKIAEGEVDLSVSDNPELSQKIQDKVIEYNAVKTIDQSLQDDSVEQTKTQIDEKQGTETKKSETKQSEVKATAKALEGVTQKMPNIFSDSIAKDIFYHSTKSKPFTKFDEKLKGSNTEYPNTGQGFFFASKNGLVNLKEQNPDAFGETELPVRLNIKNPINLTIQEIFNNKKQAKTIVEFLFNEELTEEESLQKINEEIDLGELSELNEYLSSKEFSDFVKEKGYDAIIGDMGEGNLEYIVFNPNQIQILTPEAISESYHKAKADGSNPELVKAVEELLGKKPTSQPDVEETEQVETTKTQTDETTETETVQEIGQDKLETTDTTGDAATDVELPKSTSEDTGSTQDSKRIVKTTAAQAKYGLGKRGATGKVPLDKRQPKDPDIRKASDLQIDDNDVSGFVRRYFAVNGFKILTKEISNLFNGSKEEVKRRFNMRRTPQKGGKTIDGLVHDIWESMPEGYKKDIDAYYIKNEVEKLILENKTRVEVAQELNSNYGVDEPMYTEKDGEFFNESGEQVWETEYGWLSESDIAELEVIKERAEKYKDIDEETYAEALDIAFKLTEDEINQINEADDAFIEDKINQLEQEQPKTPKQTAKEKLDKAREDFRKSGGLSTGGLQNLEQFVNLVAAYVEYGITSAKEIFKNIQASNVNIKDVSESKVEEALKTLEARDNSLEVVKNALNDVNTSTNQALEQGYDDFVKNSGKKLSKAKYKEWVATEITRESEKKRIKRTEQEVEELFEGEEKKKTDQKQKGIKLSKIKTEADIKKAQTKLRDYAKKTLPNTRFVKTEMIGVMTAIKNIKTDKNAESAKQRIDEIADKAKMRSKIASLSNFRRRGIRNLRTKLGHLYSPANAILRTKSIPEELFDKYEQVVKMLGENAKVLTVDADLVNELYQDMQVYFAVNESLDLTKDVMTEQEKENKAIRDAIKEKLKVEEQIEIYSKTAKEVRSQLVSKDIDLGNKDLNKTAIQFTNLPQNYLASLSSKELTNINKELINLSNNFISNGFIPNRVLDYKGWDKAQKTLDAKNVLGRKGTLEVFETPKDRALKDALKDVQEIEKQKISDNEKARKIEKIVDKRMKGRMSNHLSEIVKSVENQAFYANTQSLFTKAYEASNMNTKRDESIFSGLLTNAIKSLVGGVNLRTGRTTEATFEISTKLSYILRELEHQANPENKSTPSLKDIFAVQSEDIKGDNKLELSEKDFEIMQKIYDSMIKYEKDGVIDLKAFMDKELTPQEKKLVDYVRETYKNYSEKYTYIAQVTGKSPILTNEYSHRSSRRQEVIDELNPEQLWDSIANGSFNAGSLEERTTGTPLITPFAINDFVSYIDEMNTVYYMTPVLKEFNAVIKHLKQNGNKTSNIIAKTTAKNQKLNLMLTFKRNQVVSNNWHNFLKIAIRNVAIKTLISPIRFAQEISNLTVGIIKSPKIIANRKAIKELSKNKAYEKIIQDYGSSQGERLLKLSKGVYSVDFKDTDIAKTVRKGANGTDVSWGDATIEVFKNNMAREFGEKASTIYYKIVDVALPSTHKAEFLTSFKDATGKDFDANKFLNDEVYRAENEENVRQALAEADVETSDLYNTASQLESKIKTKGLDVFDIRNIMSNFMQSFSFNEWAVIRKSLGSIIGGGTSKRGNASVKLAAIMTRMVIYDVIGMYIANMIYRPDEEEEEFTKIMQKSGLNSLSLFLYGNLPGYAKWFINVGTNTAYGYYKELVENEKFVPSKDNLLYGNKLSRATDVFRLFGAFGSVMQTGVAMTDKTFTLMEKMLEGEEVTQEELIELRVYSAYYEGLATTLGLPFLKDIKALEAYLIKKQAKSSGGYTIKQKGSKKKKVVKE